MEAWNSGAYCAPGRFDCLSSMSNICMIIVVCTYKLKYDVVVQHIRKYLQDLLSLISEFWLAFTLPAPARPALGYPVSVASSPV